jgi:Ni2+-binding GTPase involved in maturation of urease and hydrogenase
MILNQDMLGMHLDINLPDSGLLIFANESGTGKTYLLELLKSLESESIAVVTYDRDENIQSAIINQIKKDSVKLVLLDRLDMYLDNSLVATINKYSANKVFLADLKHIENVGLKIKGSAVILLEQGRIRVF